jgi:hypothetical protein
MNKIYPTSTVIMDETTWFVTSACAVQEHFYIMQFKPVEPESGTIKLVFIDSLYTGYHQQIDSYG